MSRRIRMTNTGRYAFVDVDMYQVLKQWNWQEHDGRAMHHGNKGVMYMHRIIMHAPKGKIVDHKDGNALNNLRSNLRLCTHAENLRNRGKTVKSSTGYKGVYRDRKSERFKAQIMFEYTTIHIGYFDTAVEAHNAYLSVSKQLHGDFFHE